MRRDPIIKTCSLAGTSDLTVVAPIRAGFVPSLEAVTYKTRVKRVLRTLHLGRTVAHEHELARVLSDAVERVGRIHSVRIAVLEPDDKVLLAVTFDGAFESYVRVIWQKVSRLLDLIFCNTEDYVTGWDHSYDEWAAWLRYRQAETAFLYAVASLTLPDTQYLRMQERYLRRTPGGELDVVRMSIPSAEAIADESVRQGIDLTNMGYGTPLPLDEAGRPAMRQALRGLVGLHRLVDVHPPGSDDAPLLLRAAHELLPELSQRFGQSPYNLALERVRNRFDEQLEWFSNPEALPELRRSRRPPSLPPSGEFGDVQGGIVEPYPIDADHGCILLIGFDSAAALAALLAVLRPTAARDPLVPGAIATNIAFTMEGLRLAGLSADEVRALPEEFVQGMDRRAGLLGDVRFNHPSRWRLPPRNWTQGVAAADVGEDDPIERVDLNAVHVVLQLRRRADAAVATAPRDALFAALQPLVSAHAGIVPLSLQWMQRFFDAAGGPVEHFGFGDGQSQPVLKKADDGRVFRNQVDLGELLLGYANEADPAPSDTDPMLGARGLLRNGSFLVVRKLRQDLGLLDAVVQDVVANEPPSPAPPGVPSLDAPHVLAKMMGRWPSGHALAGQPLVPLTGSAAGINDFDYFDDKQAKACPFHAHIRRAHPRTTPKPAFDSPGARRPRLFRRSMPYGLRHSSAAGTPATGLDAERGLMFMAYIASLGEQFEVVQRWLAGGNASGAYSGQGDPLFGLAESGRRRYFRFEHDGRVVRMALDGADDNTAAPRPLVRLEWGMYLFAPSLHTLADLAARAGKAATPLPWSAAIGEKHIERLRQIELRGGAAGALHAWKVALEDPDAATDFTTASIWAAVRARPTGALRTPYGVLVAERELLRQVLVDADRRLTATGYLPRMHRSFGPIYLGLDAGREDGAYERQSKVCNAAIYALDPEQAYLTARTATLDALHWLTSQAQRHAHEDKEPRWDLTLDARELIDIVLARLCESWFGLSIDDGLFRRGGFRWDWREGQAPSYPGHFMAPSRYFFQPHPSAQVEQLGAAHGTALRSAMDVFLQRFGHQLTAPVSRAVLDHDPGRTDSALASRTLVGALMGFVPTVDGNLRRVLHEWLRLGSFWSLRARHAGASAANLNEARVRLAEPLARAMQFRATPDVLWRTATVLHTIGKTDKHPGIDVEPGDVIVAALTSAGQQTLEENTVNPDLSFVFGGDRSASPHPTHACPGQPAAMAAMCGFFAALVDTPQPLRAGPAPLTIAVGGPTPVPSPAAGDASASLAASLVTASAVPVWSSSVQTFSKHFAKAAPTTTLVAIGDSWLTDFFGFRPSLVSALADRYVVIADHFSPGRRLAEMAELDYLDDVERQLQSTPEAKAILFGGGGNDVVHPSNKPGKTPLYRMLRQSPSAAEDELIETEVVDFIDRELLGHFETILARLAQFKLPILIHAYDHPIPDGRPASGTHFDPWLEPVFDLRVTGDLTRRKSAMKRLIDRLNATVATAARRHPGVAYPVNLCGELAKDPRYATDYTLLWADELHPTGEGYKLLAELIANQLRTLGIQ